MAAIIDIYQGGDPYLQIQDKHYRLQTGSGFDNFYAGRLSLSVNFSRDWTSFAAER